MLDDNTCKEMQFGKPFAESKHFIMRMNTEHGRFINVRQLYITILITLIMMALMKEEAHLKYMYLKKSIFHDVYIYI